MHPGKPPLSKIDLEISLEEVIQHVKLAIDRKGNELVKRELDLVEKLKKRSMSFEEVSHELMMMVNAARFMKTGGTVVRFAQMLKNQSIFVANCARNNDFKGLNQLFPYFETLIWATDKLNNNYLEKFSQLIAQNFPPDLFAKMREANNVDLHLKELWATIEPSRFDMNDYLVGFCERHKGIKDKLLFTPAKKEAKREDKNEDFMPKVKDDDKSLHLPMNLNEFDGFLDQLKQEETRRSQVGNKKPDETHPKNDIPNPTQPNFPKDGNTHSDPSIPQHHFPNEPQYGFPKADEKPNDALPNFGQSPIKPDIPLPKNPENTPEAHPINSLFNFDGKPPTNDHQKIPNPPENNFNFDPKPPGVDFPSPLDPSKNQLNDFKIGGNELPKFVPVDPMTFANKVLPTHDDKDKSIRSDFDFSNNSPKIPVLKPLPIPETKPNFEQPKPNFDEEMKKNQIKINENLNLGQDLNNPFRNIQPKRAFDFVKRIPIAQNLPFTTEADENCEHMREGVEEYTFQQMIDELRKNKV